jgi:hypothetical protein
MTRAQRTGLTPGGGHGTELHAGQGTQISCAYTGCRYCLSGQCLDFKLYGLGSNDPPLSTTHPICFTAPDHRRP